jgi:hypothetical protein
MAISALKQIEGSDSPVARGMRDIDVQDKFQEGPVVHSADLGGAGGKASIAWQSKSMNVHGKLQSRGAWNAGSAVNFNASSAQLGQVSPPGGG